MTKRAGPMIGPMIVLALAACSQQPEGGDAQASASPAKTVAAPAVPVPPTLLPVAARKVSEENDVYSFTYSYPAAAGVVAGLKASLDADLNDRLARLKRDAAEGKAEAEKGGFPFHAWYWSQEWKVVSDLPGWISLSADFANYTGGAHGMHWFGAMLWDRQADRARDPLTLFRSKQALADAIRKPFCAELDRQRAKKRGEPVDPQRGGMFEACIDPTAQTVILGSATKKAFDRIGILVAPYEAGPYAEGAYEVTVPVTAAVIAAVRPEFRPAFAALSR